MVPHVGSSAAVNSRDVIDPKVKWHLDCILEENVGAILLKYSSYVNCVRNCIEKKNIPPKDLQASLLTMPAFGNTDKGQQLYLLADKKEQLLSSMTVIDISS